jgi:hypothetical protein
VKAYSRYIDAEPSEQSDAQERIESLSAAPPSFPPPPSRRKWLLPGALGGGAVALLAVGTGLLGSAAVEYKHLKQTCSPGCAPSAWDGLQGRETAGWVLTGLAGVAVIVDVALIVRATRRK